MEEDIPGKGSYFLLWKGTQKIGREGPLKSTSPEATDLPYRGHVPIKQTHSAKLWPTLETVFLMPSDSTIACAGRKVTVEGSVREEPRLIGGLGPKGALPPNTILCQRNARCAGRVAPG
jgi:hypothetical protein